MVKMSGNMGENSEFIQKNCIEIWSKLLEIWAKIASLDRKNGLKYSQNEWKYGCKQQVCREKMN